MAIAAFITMHCGGGTNGSLQTEDLEVEAEDLQSSVEDVVFPTRPPSATETVCQEIETEQCAQEHFCDYFIGNYPEVTPDVAACEALLASPVWGGVDPCVFLEGACASAQEDWEKRHVLYSQLSYNVTLPPLRIYEDDGSYSPIFGDIRDIAVHYNLSYRITSNYTLDSPALPTPLLWQTTVPKASQPPFSTSLTVGSGVSGYLAQKNDASLTAIRAAWNTSLKGALGYVYANDGPNRLPLHSCSTITNTKSQPVIDEIGEEPRTVAANSFLTTLDNCSETEIYDFEEGTLSTFTVGFLMPARPEGGVGVYRCIAPLGIEVENSAYHEGDFDTYLSIDSTCAGYRSEDAVLLGYAEGDISAD